MSNVKKVKKEKKTTPKAKSLSGMSFSASRVTKQKAIDVAKNAGLAIVGNIGGNFLGKGANKVGGVVLMLGSVATGMDYLMPLGLGMVVSTPDNANIFKGTGEIEGIDGVMERMQSRKKVLIASANRHLSDIVGQDYADKLLAVPLSGLDGDLEELEEYEPTRALAGMNAEYFPQTTMPSINGLGDVNPQFEYLRQVI